MPERRSALLLAMGVVGLVLGIVAVAADLPVLGLAAGVLALALGLIVTFVPEPGAPVAALDPPSPAEVVAAVPATATATATATAAEVPPAAEPARSSLADPTTGLFNEEFFRVAVETRVSAARRHLRPVAIVLFEVADVEPSGTPVTAGAVEVATAVKDTLREADTACRLDDGRFAFVLEDTPEDGAIWTVERLRRRLSESGTTQIRWAGVACYPAHSFSAHEALAKAEKAFLSAKEWAQDRIEVATAD